MLHICDEVKRGIVDALVGLSGAERAETVRRYAALYAISPKTISAIMRKAGHRARPAVRRDRGRSLVTSEEITQVAAMVKGSRRLDGNYILPVCDAVETLQDLGVVKTQASRSTFCRLLRASSLSAHHLAQPTPFQYRSTAHPNAEWQLDATNCVQYFLDDHGLGERDIEMQLHKNHPAEFRKIRRELLRYAVVDHHSGMFWFQYFYAPGERAKDTLEFLIEAMQPKAHQGYQFHGVPFRLFVDKGSLARAKMSQDFLQQMQVDLVKHLPGNPRAKGLVEWLHKFLLRFEALLKYHRPPDLQTLNRWAWEWAVRVCCTWPFRAKIDASGRTRLQRWLTITPEQLRVPQPTPVLRAALRTGFRSPTVDKGGRFLFQGRPYHMPDTNAWGGQVEVCYSPYRYPEVSATWRAEDGSVRGMWTLAPLQTRDDGWLEDTALPGTIRRPAATATQQAAPTLERTLSETFGNTWTGTGDKRRAEAPRVGAQKREVFGRHAEVADKLASLPTPGVAHRREDPQAERRLSLMGLLGELADALGRPLTRDENTRIRDAWPAGCRMGEIDAIADGLHGDRKEGHNARQIGAG